ncbi:MAG: aminotransferase class V-fold PLP-dependent enzyme [Bacteroides sp.]|nr:aminotransferase class V-fold PLP-dependent enzyme [Bacillota bacterium]MCM1393431.1 aminotransferase class V-fold PLP-dependent enzyme [[Eubacterium] siraeum]MCM1455069.1 aminotransferase class V-fold PLP-dependent enzyme [Bacteroides sp.]
MLYLDNAATSRFKPQGVIDAINFDLRNSVNSGRGGYTDAVSAGIRIENCRYYLKSALGAEDDYEAVFTKNCTEALNLAIFGGIKGGERVLTTSNEHNSVLRPLYELERQGKITLDVLDTHGKKIDLSALNRRAANADVIVIGGACNVTGATVDLYEVGKIAKANNALLIVDGAQSVPILQTNMKECGIDMFACAGHKGLHGIQGSGFLIFKSDIKLRPILFGGTGTYSSSVYQPLQAPDGYEAGTLFAGGISALYEGAKWSFNHLDTTIKNYNQLTSTLLYNLKSAGCTLYTDETVTGVVAFNMGNADSAYVAELLNEQGIAVRSGLHCAPLVHKALGTESQGAVRVSIGVETAMKDVQYFSSVIEKLKRKLKV